MTGRAEYAEHRCIDFLDLQGDDFTAIKAWCEARRLPERAVWTESACFGTVNNPLVGVMTGIPRKGDWDNLQVGDYKISKVSYIDWSYQQ